MASSFGMLVKKLAASCAVMSRMSAIFFPL